MDDFRAQLDQLMGADRNLSLEERKHFKPRTRSYRDSEVCKYFLCGFCPYEEFRRTKNDCGDCPCMHDEDAKREWDALDDRSRERTGYEDDLLKWMERLLVDLKKRIDTNTERLAAAEKPLFLVDDQAKLEALTARINELVAKSQMLGEQGDIDGAQAALHEAEQVKVQRSVAEQTAMNRSGNSALKGLQQTVCPISGLIINKEESRIEDHLNGRNYNSWKKMHEVHAKLLEAMRARRGGGGYRSGGSSRDERERGGRDKDRSYRDSRSSGRDERERDRSYRSGSGRDERERDRSYRSGSGRDERGRDRDRERERGGYERRDYRDRGDRDRGRRDRERSPARPRAPRVEESDFVVEYQNEAAAAQAATKQQAAVPVVAAAAPGAQYYDTSFDPAYAVGAAPPATAAVGAPDWGVDYGPAKPLTAQPDPAPYYPAA